MEKLHQPVESGVPAVEGKMANLEAKDPPGPDTKRGDAASTVHTAASSPIPITT